MKTTSLLLPFLATLQPSWAFTPTKAYSVFGWIGISHYEQTENMLLALTRAIYPNIDVDNDPLFKQARDDIGTANAKVDDDQHHGAKHMGGESFPGGQRFIMDLRISVKEFLKINNTHGARISLGESLHTLQDFYSHSNWIELGYRIPHPQIGKVGGVIGALAPNVATCKPCGSKTHRWRICHQCDDNMFAPRMSEMLTSGYFHDEDYVKPNDGKCSHGGIFDKTTNMQKGGINKDTILCELSPHGSLHYDAVAVSEAATLRYLKDVMNDLTTEERDALLGRTSVVVRAAADFASASQLAMGMPATRKRDIHDTEYFLEPLENFNTGTKTRDPNEFHRNMKRHIKRGGTTNPDAVSKGILSALNHVPSGGTLLIHARSELNGCHNSAVANLAADRRIKIVFASADSTGGSNGLAYASGGHVLDDEGASALTAVIHSSDAVTLYRSEKGGQHSVAVDPSVSQLRFSGKNIIVKCPNGSSCPSDIEMPAPGVYTVTSSSALTVTGRSEVRLDDFSLVQRWGRPAHEGYFRVHQQVLAGDTYVAVANPIGTIEDVEYHLSGIDSAKPIPIKMIKTANITEVFGNVTIPIASRESFIFKMVGNVAGYRAVRQWPVPVVASPMSVRIRSVNIDKGDIAEVKVVVGSKEGGKFEMNALLNNAEYKILKGGNQDCKLDAGQKKEFTIEVKVPHAAKGTSAISIVVKDPRGGEVVTSRTLPWVEKNHKR